MSSSYYKVIPGSPAHSAIKELSKKMFECHKARNEILYEFGAENYIDGSQAFRTVYGGITGFVLDVCPAGWRKPYSEHKNVFFPKKTKENMDLLVRINALPVISTDEFNAVIGYESFQTGKTWHTSWGLNFYKETFLVNMAYNKEYKPLEGMQEITITEYEKLKEEHREWSKQEKKKMIQD